MRKVVSEGLALVRGRPPLRLNTKQLTCLARHFQLRVSRGREGGREGVKAGGKKGKKEGEKKKEGGRREGRRKK